MMIFIWIWSTFCVDANNISVNITACNDWSYGSISNSLQMQLKGSDYPSEFFYVNQLSTLPINGQSMSFDIELTTDIADLLSIVIAVDDNYGYCLQTVIVTISQNVSIFSSDEYFGNGIILSNECDYSFRYLSDHMPLISCHDDPLELSTYSTRGMYELDIHTCISDASGMTASNMKDNVYAVCHISIYILYSCAVRWFDANDDCNDQWFCGWQVATDWII